MGSLLTGIKTEMPLSFSVSGASQQEDSLSGGGELRQLIESVCLSSSSKDSLSGSSGELESSNSESLGDVEEPDIVGDGTNNGNNSGVVLGLALSNSSAILTEMSGDSGDGDGVSVQSRLVEALVHHLVEFRLSPAGQEGVELHYLGCTLIRLFR